MPGFVTLKPVALASVVASSDSLVPSANEVTMKGRMPVRVGEALLRVGVAVMVEEALDVAGQHRPVADRLDEAEHVHRHTRLVAVGVGYHHARAVGEDLEHRADGGVQLGIHEHDVLAVGDRLGDGAGAVLHLAGALDDRLDLRRAAQQQRV